MMFDDVKEKLKNLGTSPIFFVGSGLSRRYIDSPDWLGLLEKTMDGTGINFSRYKQKHTHKNQISNKDEVNMEALAQELEDVYFDMMPEEKLEEYGSKGYYYRKRVCQVISKCFQDNKDHMLSNEEVIELKKTSPSAIITTNYDEMLEEIFREEYTTHVGQTSLLTSVVDGVGDIYKIHGCVKEPDSIIITKDDYDKFFDKDIYLNAKLLTLFLEYPIVFLGYSISDRNVKSILTTIVKMLPYEKVEELKSRIWFIKRAIDNTDKEDTERIQLDDGLYIDIKSYALSNYGEFYKAINDISIKKLPIRFLKYLKNNVYELVASQEYNPKLIDVNINEIEKINNFNEGNNFVGLTFSTKEKKVFSNKIDICRAFINEEEENYDPMSILGFKKETNGFIPFYKFIRNLKANEILDYVKEIVSEQSDLYLTIISDSKNYKKSLGAEMNGFNYLDEITSENITQYINDYMSNNGIYSYQKGTVQKYFMLNLLKNRLDNLLDASEVCFEYSKELTLAITNLDEEFVRENFEKIKIIIRNINPQRYNGSYRNLLCFIDKVIYRSQIEGISFLSA